MAHNLRSIEGHIWFLSAIWIHYNNAPWVINIGEEEVGVPGNHGDVHGAFKGF